MTIECIDGFSSYSATSGDGSMTSDDKWRFTSQTAWAFVTPAMGGRGVRAVGAATAPRMNKVFTASANVACGFMFRCEGLASVVASQNLVAFGYANGAAINVTTMNQVRFQLNANGSISAITNTADNGATVVLGTTAAGVIVAGNEHFIALELVVDQTVGRVTLWVDNVQVLNLTNQDTAALATALVDYIGFVSHTSGSVAITIGHFWLRRDAATILGTRLRVDAIVPNGDVSNTGFVPSTGTSLTNCIDELPQSATDYIQAGDVGDNAVFDLTPLPVTPTNIYGINVVGWAQKLDNATRAYALGIKSGATTSDGPNKTLLVANTIATRIVETDPDTGVAFTLSGVNALQLAPKITV